VEFGDPYELIVKDPLKDNGITNTEGELAQLILETGDKSSKQLFLSAKKAY